MWWILGIVAVILIVSAVKKDHRESVYQNVTRHGGMRVKYHTLVTYFITHPNFRITRETKDHLTILGPTVTVYIDNVAGDTEIKFTSIVPVFGKVTNKWKYQPGYPQEKMIEEIENFLDLKLKQFNSIVTIPKPKGRDVVLNTYGVESFKALMNIHRCVIKKDSVTGEVYFTYGNQKGKVVGWPHIVKPMISEFVKPNGEKYFLLYDQSQSKEYSKTVVAEF